jgi:5-formyltetrahydrofolate cyclo-ligase
MRARCLAVDTETALRAGRAAAEQLAATSQYRRCRQLVAYAELAGELPLGCVVERARADGKDVLWPRQRADGGLDFAPCARVEELAAGRYGVLEPPRATPAMDPGPDSLLLVPGVAFDERGGRLGRGGGAWDRALAESHGAFAFGVGYEFQVVSAVPREVHDRSVDALLTERGVRRCSGR